MLGHIDAVIVACKGQLIKGNLHLYCVVYHTTTYCTILYLGYLNGAIKLKNVGNKDT